MKSIVAGMLAGVMLLTATPALAAEESAEQVAVTAAKPLSTEQRIADLENELKELKAMYTKDKTVQAKKDKDAADRLQFKGKAKLEQEWDSKGDKALSSKKNKVQFDLEQIYKINNVWSADLLERATHTFDNSDSDAAVQMRTAAMIGQLGKSEKITLGRFKYEELSGLSIGDTWLSGVDYSFGKTWETNIVLGRTADIPGWKKFGKDGDNPFYKAITTEGKVGVIGVGAAARQVSLHGNNEYLYEGELDIPVCKNLALQYNAFNSTADNYTGTGAFGYLTKLQFSQIDKKKPGTFDIFVQYSKVPKANDVYSGSSGLMDKKIFRVGGEYVFQKNVWAKLIYDHGHKIAGDELYQDLKATLNFAF